MPLIIEASGPFPWKSQDANGTTTRFVVDFAPFAQGVGSAYAVFEDDAGTPRRYDLPPGVAAAVLDRAYDSTVMVLPSYNPVDWGLLKDQVLLIPDLVIASPAP
jgi:hypothetical protein